MGGGEKGLQIFGRVGRRGEWCHVHVGIFWLVEQGQVKRWVGFEEVEGGGDFCGVHYLVYLCRIERGSRPCCSGAGVVGLRCVDRAERKAD